MLQLVPTKINAEKIHLEFSDSSIRFNSYIKIKKAKNTYFAKVQSINNEEITINNPGIDNFVDWKFYSIEENQNIIYNPLILGHQINQFGQVINNEQIYSLKKPNPRKKTPKTNFFLNHNESLEKEFVFLGAELNNNLKPIIDLQVNNVQNYTFLNLTKVGNTSGVKTLKLLEKFNLHHKNLFLEIDDSSDIDTVEEYINFIKEGLNSNTCIVFNASEWTDQQLFELTWVLNKIPKIIIFSEDHKDRKIKKYCSVIISD